MMQDRRLGAAGTKRMLQHRKTNANQSYSAVLRMHMVGTEANAQPNASEPQPGKVNYFFGKTRHSGARTFLYMVASNTARFILG